MRARSAAGGKAARYAVGDCPKARWKLVVKGAHAAKPHRDADVCDRAVCASQERRGALEPAGQQVLMRRLAENAAELAAEVRGR
jgi:hypothetical protein